MAYILDLVQQVQLRLSPYTLSVLELTNSGWSLDGGFWRTKFLRAYGVSLPNGVDYELEYIVIGSLYKRFIPYTIKKHYNNIAMQRLNLKDATLLPKAAMYGNREMVMFLLDNGADIHADNNLALKLAAIHSNTDMIKLLLDNGANIHAYSDETLLLAVGSGRLDVVKFLLDNGANIHAKDDLALQRASRKGYLEVVKLLLDNGADIHADNDWALEFAAEHNHLDVVKLLIERGANIKALRKIRMFPASTREYLQSLNYKD